MESSLDLVSDSASSASDDSEDVHDLVEMGELEDTQKAALIKELQKVVSGSTGLIQPMQS